MACLFSLLTVLIARKNSILKRISTNFRFLNSRLQRVNLDFLSIRDPFAILGISKCECFLVLDSKDAYYTIKLSESYKPHCGILSYFGSASYLDQRIPASPVLWQSYINAILSSVYGRLYLAIMDNLFLHISKLSHLKYLEYHLQPLLQR